MTAVFASNGIAFGTWAGNIPRLRAEAGLDDGSLGLVLLCVSLGAVAAMQVAGRYGARIGTARAAWMAALVLAAALPLPALAPGFPALLASGVLLGLGLGMLDVCMNAHAAGLERQWGAAIMSSFHAGWSLGELAGAAGAAVLAGVGLAWALAMPAVLVAGCGLAALRLAEQRAAPSDRVRFAWPSWSIVALGVMLAMSFAIEGGTADWSGVYLSTVLDAPTYLASSSLGVFAAAMVAMRLVGDRLVRRLGPLHVIRGGALLAAAGLLAAILAPSLWVAAAGFALVGAGVANIVPILFSAAGRNGPLGVSMVSTAGYGALMAAPPVIGFVSNTYGLRAGLLLPLAGAVVLAALARRAV